MEYEKHIKKLVLGYLKTKCKSSYKTFLRTNFPSPSKHIGTRVAGQTLEDILRIYSQVQEIVQARLEYTDYYKEHDGSAPMYLVEQLLYLLDRRQIPTPTTTIRDRSPCGSSLADYANEEHFSDVETTPEHTLPGNTPSNDPNSQTPFRSHSFEFKTPYSENIPASNHEYITSVMSQTLLKNSSFPHKLADTINAVLEKSDKKPDFPALCRKDDNGDAEKMELGSGLENTIQQALNRTERDSIFEGLLEELWEPLTNSFGKAITAEAAAITTSINSKKHVSQETYTKVEEHNDGAISSILAVSNTDLSANQLTNEVASSSTDTPQVTSTQHNYQITPDSQVPPNSQITPNSQVMPNSQVTPNSQVDKPLVVQTVQPNIPLPINSQPVYQGPIYTIPGEQSQPQYFFFDNRPLVLPPQVQMMQIIQAPKGKSKGKLKLSEGDIMAMPTIILNEKNEVAYTDPNRVSTNNASCKLTEVHNIKEYFNVFGATPQSPIIKTTQPIKPTPVVKVEIYHRDTALPTTKNTSSKDLPNIANATIEEEEDVIIVSTDPSSTEKGLKSTPNETRVEPIKPISAHTPSPLVTVAKKPTPKSSSHVRNLTFPSPLKKTGEKDDGGRNLPSAISKQQATKDLFKSTPEEIEKPKVTTPKKLKNTPKKPTKAKKTVAKKTASKSLENATPHSWDSALRKNLAATAAEEANELTPLRRTSSRIRVTRSSELDSTEIDGKMIEDALKTPIKPAEKPKGKTPRKRTRAENKSKTNEEKLPQIEEVVKVEASVEPKTILSPSNLCNTASKRNMEFDGITPNNSKEGCNQLVSNARKNISVMLETPLKDDQIETNIPPTPLTPMLQANLKDYTSNGNYSIHTPNFPITPGLAFNMESSSAPYYTLNDTETNKATEAIVLSEERKSSVRKTDDEEVVISPNVYSGKDILKEFNKRCIGKKNLNLLSQENVQWDGGSDKEYHSEESLSDQTNNTIIPNNRKRSSGKCMSMLKSNLLNESIQDITKSEANIEDKMENKVQAKGVSSSSDSEVISKTEHANKKKLDAISEENTNIVDATKKCEQSCANVSISKITADTIKEAVSATTLTSHMTTEYSIKKEMEEKRKRMISLEKAGPKAQGGRQRKPNLKSASKKRKKSIPKKWQKDLEDSEENDDNNTDSQDEFFKKSGTNLHRTRKQMEELGKSEKRNDKSRQSPESEVKLSSEETPKGGTSNSENFELDESIYGYRVVETLSKEIHIKYDPKKSSKKVFEDYDLDIINNRFKFYVPLQNASYQVIYTIVEPFKFVLEMEPSECGSDLEILEEARSKKRKHRTSSTNSNASCKKLKTNLMPNSLAIPSSLGGKDVIEKVLAQLHGPSDKI